MKGCVLCLQSLAGHSNYIQVQSSQWLQLNIVGIIKKHFWPIDDLQYTLGICLSCWKQLYDFHKFYLIVAEAHRRNIEIVAEQQQVYLQHSATYNNRDNQTDRKPTFECFFENEVIEQTSPNTNINLIPSKARIVKTEKNDMETDKTDFLPLPINDVKISTNFVTIDNEDDNTEQMQIASTVMSNEKESVPIPTALLTVNCNTKEQENCYTYIKVKNKRGRPRKIRDLNEILKKPAGKRGRPRKYAAENDELTQKKQIKSKKRGRPCKLLKEDEIIKKNFPTKGKRGRPRKIVISDSDFTKPSNQPTNGNELNIQNRCPIVQPVALLKDITLSSTTEVEHCHSIPTNEIEQIEILNSNSGTKELKYKKIKSFHMIKKRKRIQQHKNLMRNYIATSVRCMNFLKKDN